MEIKECEECKTLFEQTRDIRRFCSKQCSSKNYSKKKIKRNKELDKKPKNIKKKFLTRGNIHYHGLLLDKDK